MKIRKDCRRIILDKEIYQYKIGRSHIKIYDPVDKRHNINYSKLLGVSWSEIDYDVEIKPKDIEQWIRKNLKN